MWVCPPSTFCFISLLVIAIPFCQGCKLTWFACISISWKQNGTVSSSIGTWFPEIAGYKFLRTWELWWRSCNDYSADLWKKIIGSPSLDDYIKKPDILSFYIASKLPVSESRRQDLLEIDGISYRLQKEIQFLKSFNLIRCKNCLVRGV